MAQKWYQSKDAKIAFVGSAAIVISSLIGLVGVCSGNKQAPIEVNQFSTSQTSNDSKPAGRDSVNNPDSSKRPSSIQPKPEKEPKKLPLPQPPVEPPSTTYYQIKVHVSSKMKDASFFVDGEPAQIIDDQATVKVIRVKAKDSNHTISVKKDSVECSKQLFITQNNVVVTLCP
ncbi:hypothetical protein HUU05_23895 [candidate division KSB1 bacterium]|nr:hypothetical protein [candidate division KSB1 bacterium]